MSSLINRPLDLLERLRHSVSYEFDALVDCPLTFQMYCYTRSKAIYQTLKLRRPSLLVPCRRELETIALCMAWYTTSEVIGTGL